MFYDYIALNKRQMQHRSDEETDKQLKSIQKTVHKFILVPEEATTQTI